MKTGKINEVDWDEHVCNCEVCDSPCEIVRPGKCQETCECHLICYICKGTYERFDQWNPHPIFPRWFGEYCRGCGPGGILHDIPSLTLLGKK